MTSTNAERAGPAGRPLSPEHELLLACARVDPGPAARERIRALSERVTSWGLLEREAAFHGLAPLVHRNLSRHAADACPAAVLERGRAAATASAWRSLPLTAELLGLVEDFRREAVPLAVLKGPVAAQALYGELSLRPFGDLDLLVPGARAGQARALLKRRGYSCALGLRPGWDDVHGRTFHERPFRREAPAVVDLHWGLASPGYSFSREPDGLWERVEEVALGGATVPTLGAQDMLWFFCLHAAKHGWSRMKWTCDTAELLRRAGPALDWDQVVASAAARGASRQLHVSLVLAHRLLGAPVPADVLAAGRADRQVAGLVDRVIAAMLPPEGTRPPGPVLPWGTVYYRALERTRDRLRLVFDASLAPRIVDWQSVPLPASLCAVYYGIRPLRLLGKYVLGGGARRRARPGEAPE